MSGGYYDHADDARCPGCGRSRHVQLCGDCESRERLEARIAKALGWPLADVRSFSRPALRDLVRPVDKALADELSESITSGSYLKASMAAMQRRLAPAPPVADHPYQCRCEDQGVCAWCKSSR